MEHIPVLLQVAQLIAYIVAGIIFLVMLKADVRILRNDFKLMKNVQDTANNNISRLSDALTVLAVQDSRLKGIEEDIRDLKHGRGFIADGEYNVKGKARGT